MYFFNGVNMDLLQRLLELANEMGLSSMWNTYLTALGDTWQITLQANIPAQSLPIGQVPSICAKFLVEIGNQLVRLFLAGELGSTHS